MAKKLPDLSTMKHHVLSERIVDLLCERTQANNNDFYRVLVGYYFSVIASHMRCNILTHERGIIPVNTYAVCLATSGAGKGFSTNLMEQEILSGFKQRFLHETFPFVADKSLRTLWIDRAIRYKTTEDEEEKAVKKEFFAYGAPVFTFDSGSAPAIKQVRQKVIMAKAGALSLQIDEIGSNLLANLEGLTVFLELYDKGFTKQKLLKSSGDSSRYEEHEGSSPANLLAFGTPTKLLNGGKPEEEFISLLETGYARRCLFAYLRKSSKMVFDSPEALYDMLTQGNYDQVIEQLNEYFEDLADGIHLDKKIQMDKDTAIQLIEYRMLCEAKADKLAEHEEMIKAEISHRYFKALKLAGAYAFVDMSPDITEEHLYAAIAVTEESGAAFQELIKRERPHVRLAKWLGSIKRQVTLADMAEELPYFKGTTAAKTEMITYAQAWGYRNQVIIKKIFEDGIEFLAGETLQETDLFDLTATYSNDFSLGYQPHEKVEWNKLWMLTQAEDFHWCNHKFVDGHRQEVSALQGFNLIIMDVDGTVSLDTVKEVLADYTYLIHTTKRHQTDGKDRFRLIMPMNYTLKLDANDYKEFMSSIFNWMPFDSDEQTSQRSRKWLTHPGEYWYNEGMLMDVIPFIPKTSKNEEYLQQQQTLNGKNLDSLKRWFISNTGSGNRNNNLYRYGMILKDAGKNFSEVIMDIQVLNSCLPDSVTVEELNNTVIKSLSRHFIEVPA